MRFVVGIIWQYEKVYLSSVHPLYNGTESGRLKISQSDSLCACLPSTEALIDRSFDLLGFHEASCQGNFEVRRIMAEKFLRKRDLFALNDDDRLGS